MSNDSRWYVLASVTPWHLLDIRGEFANGFGNSPKFFMRCAKQGYSAIVSCTLLIFLDITGVLVNEQITQQMKLKSWLRNNS